MIFRTAMLSLVTVLVTASLSFGVTFIIDNGFPYKGIVMKTKTFKGMDLTSDDFKTVKNSLYSWEFTVQGKAYKADMLTFGAIYMTREGQNPVIISMDFRDYRFKSLHLLVEQ